MKLSKEKGMQIVREMARILPYPINVMDEAGVIIASTDAVRIGGVHAGAERILREGLSELVIRPGEEVAGAMAGSNLPISIFNETVGVIGITGEPDEVAVYGRIIKKMTEILLIDLYNSDQRRLIEQAKDALVQDWLFGAQELPNPSFEVRSRQLHIELALPRAAVVLIAPRAFESGEKRLQMIQQVQALLELDDLIAVEEKRITLLMRAAKEKEATARADKLAQSVAQSLSVGVYCGISQIKRDYAAMRSACREAAMACEVARYRRERAVAFNSLTVEPLLVSIPEQMRQYYVERVFGAYSQSELAECLQTLEAFFRNDGSVTRAAEECFVHKNTFQYRLKQIARRTGIDVRRPSQGPLLYIALLLCAHRGADENDG